MHYKIAQLSLTPNQKANITSEIYVAQPDSAKEELAGKLFVLIEVESRKSECLKIINYLVDNLNFNYYQNEKILLREKISTLKVEHIFEAALAKTNKNFEEFIKAEKISINYRINVVAGIIYKDFVHFTIRGKNRIFLIQKSPSKELRTDNPVDQSPLYKLFDITKQIDDEQDKPSNIKLFSSIISGQITPDNYIFVTNEALPEYVSQNQLIKIITTLPPVSAIEQIKNLLQNINTFVPFSGLLIKSVVQKTEEDAPIQISKSTQESIINLNKTEEVTETLLTPSGIINFKKITRFFTFNTFRNNNKKQANEDLYIKDRVFVKKRSSFTFFKRLYQFIKNLFVHAFNAIFYFFKIVKKRDTSSAETTDVSAPSIGLTKTIFNKLKTAKNKSIVFLFLFLIFVILFSTSLLIQKSKKQNLKQEQSYNKLAALIELKQDEVDANLLYSNNEGAKKLFEEINNLLTQLPTTTEEQKQKYNEFNNKLEKQLETVRKVVYIENIEKLADFQNLNGKAKPENIILLPELNKIYAGDSTEKSIYILDINNNLTTTITNLGKEITSFHYPVRNSQNEIFYYNQKNIISFDAETETMKELNINQSDNSRIMSSDTYNDHLYLLDANNNQIYKYSRDANGFSGRQEWMQDQVDLSQAVDISIDGHIYILLSTGELLKFLRGSSRELKLDTVEPPIDNPLKVFVSPEEKYIYVLDSLNRIILFDKTGKFLMQYKSDTLNNIHDFIVDESSKQIFILNETSIFKFSGTHWTD